MILPLVESPVKGRGTQKRLPAGTQMRFRPTGMAKIAYTLLALQISI